MSGTQNHGTGMFLKLLKGGGLGGGASDASMVAHQGGDAASAGGIPAQQPGSGTLLGNYINSRSGDPNGTTIGNDINAVGTAASNVGQQFNTVGPTYPVQAFGVPATPQQTPMIPLQYTATGAAVPANNYAEGGPTMPRGVAHVPVFHAPTMGVKVFKPHLMNNSHPHTASIKAGSSAGANPRTGVGMSMRGMGGAGAMHSAPMGAVDNKTGGMPAGGGTPAGIGAGSPAAFAEGGAIPANPQDPYGRADNVPLNTTAGSYVVPKSVVDKKGSHFFDKIIAEHGDHADRAAAHLRLQGMPTMQGGGGTPVNVSGGEHIIPRSVVAKLGTHHFDKIVAKEGDRTDRQAAEMRLAGQPSGPGNGPPIPPNQLRGAIPRNNPLGRAI